MMRVKDQIRSAAEGLGSKPLLRDEILVQVTTPDDVISFLNRYQLFNGNFAGGVAGLAGAFHIRQNLFRELSVTVSAAVDRSARIASHIYFAAEDEYADRHDHTRVTHRDLGQYVLLGTCEYFDVNQDDVDRLYPINSATIQTLSRVDRGYCQEQVNTEETLLRGLGFHIGSELLADEEFNLIDAHLRHAFPKLVTFLEEKKTNRGQDCYRWISLHCKVEVEHLDHAFRAADLVLEHYVGNYSERRVAELIVDGFLEFGDMQKYFFSQILDRDPSERMAEKDRVAA